MATNQARRWNTTAEKGSQFERLSAPEKRAFKEWLRERYKDDAALRRQARYHWGATIPKDWDR